MLIPKVFFFSGICRVEFKYNGTILRFSNSLIEIMWESIIRWGCRYRALLIFIPPVLETGGALLLIGLPQILPEREADPARAAENATKEPKSFQK